MDVRIADGPNAQTIPMTLERFTLVGATTRFGLLTPPMRARFGLVERLNFYPAEDLAADRHPVGRASCRCRSTPRAPLEIARRSRGTPRVANRLLRRVRDYAQVRAERADHRRGGRARRWPGSTWTSSASTTWTRASSRTIIEKFGGGPVGLNTLAVAVGEDSGHAGRGVRAVPHPAGIPRAHPARPLRHRQRLSPLRHHAAARAGHDL